MDVLVQNLRYAVRTLWRSPAFALIVTAILGLGIGANTAIFSAVDAVLLRPSPYVQPEELANVERTAPGVDAPVMPWTYTQFRNIQHRRGPFRDVAAYGAREMTLGGRGEPARVNVELVSENYLSLLGIAPALGRGLAAADPRVTGIVEVVLGNAVWAQQFGSQGDVIGQNITLNGAAATVVGVMPRGFHGETGNGGVWVSALAAPALTGDKSLLEPWVMWFSMIGRLRPGVDPAGAAVQMTDLAKALAAEDQPIVFGEGKLLVTPILGSRIEPGIRSALLIVFAAAAIVLTIACLNISSLLLARAAGRQREIAVRRALGATRARLAAQLLTESVVLAVVGGALGLLVAFWMIELLDGLRPAASPGFWAGYAKALDFHEIRVDGRVLGYTAFVTLASGLLFGMFPAWRAQRGDLSAALKYGAPGAASSGRLARLHSRSLLVVAEIALALVLLTSAGLLVKSFTRMRATDFGFRAERVITMKLNLPATTYTKEQYPRFYEELVERTRALPGVDGVSLSSTLPLSGRSGDTDFVPEGKVRADGEEATIVDFHVVSPAFFQTMGIALRAGRTFTDADRPGSGYVAVINAATAQKFWPGENPVGKHVGLLVAISSRDPVEIVGVVENVQYGGIGEPERPDVYVTFAQRPVRAAYLNVRTQADPAGLTQLLRQQVRALDPTLAISEIRTMNERVNQAASRVRFGAVLISMFAALAAVLSALGIYGLMAHTVTSRTREIGIRLALGGQRGDVLRTVLGDSVSLAAAGIALGLLGAFAATRVLQSQLYEVAPHDPASFIGAALLFALTALVAGFIPARRATRVDPVVSLKHD